MQAQPSSGLDRINENLAHARTHERVLASDLAEARENLEQLIEERWIALDELADRKAVWTPLEQAPPTKPGVVHTRRDALVLALVAITCTGVWAVVGALVVLALRLA